MPTGHARSNPTPLSKIKQPDTWSDCLILAGDEGFEPPITGPEPAALPLGQSPVFMVLFYPKAGGTVKILIEMVRCCPSEYGALITLYEC